MSRLEIALIEKPAEVREFVEFPWRIYAADPRWAPPLKSDMLRRLDPARHPFWHSAERALFVARRGQETVGRIAGIVDHNYNRYHEQRMAAWGFFECADDAPAAAGLFSAVEDWARGRDMAFLRGPLNPSINYEIGLLIEGFEHPPTFMMTYNPGYYARLVENSGHSKEKDLVAFLLTKGHLASQRLQRLAEKIERRNKFSVRIPKRRDFDQELELLKKLYHASWSDAWGFVPMTDEEITDMGRSLRHIIDPDVVFFFYHEAEPVGVILLLPDINPLLRRLNGKLGLLGLVKWMVYRKEVRGLRGVLFGIKPEYHNQGLPLVAFNRLEQALRGSVKYDFMELGWNLEDNKDINQFETELGARQYKRFRIYHKPL